MDQAQALIPLLLAAFAGLWTSVCILVSRIGGWSRLAGLYRAPSDPGGRTFWLQSASLGWGNYNSCLTVRVSPQGLYLAVLPMFRPGHPPLLIPWGELSAAGKRTFLLWTYYEVEVGSPRAVTMKLPARVVEAARAYAGW